MKHLDENMALMFGINEAIIAQFLWDSINEGDKKEMIFNYNDDEWIKCSMLLMTGYMPFLSLSMIKKAIKNLVEGKVLRKGCFNENRFDNTNWYSFTKYGKYLMGGYKSD